MKSQIFANISYSLLSDGRDNSLPTICHFNIPSFTCIYLNPGNTE